MAGGFQISPNRTNRRIQPHPATVLRTVGPQKAQKIQRSNPNVGAFGIRPG
jgi:hypothetical protein